MITTLMSLGRNLIYLIEQTGQTTQYLPRLSLRRLTDEGVNSRSVPQWGWVAEMSVLAAGWTHPLEKSASTSGDSSIHCETFWE